MNHLTDEQFEDLIAGRTAEHDCMHVTACAECRARLAEARAIAARLKQAFAGIQTPAALAEKIRLQSRAAEAAVSRRSARRVVAHCRSYAAAAAAIAALIIIVPAVIWLTTPASAVAALADIHNHNISESGAFVGETNPARLAAYFREHLGFNPRLPEPDHGLALRGCCVRYFQGDVAGSYVVATPSGIMSVVVVRQTPQRMELTDYVMPNGLACWRGSFADKNIVSVRIGEYSYCAVGAVSHDYLANLLARLID